MDVHQTHKITKFNYNLKRFGEKLQFMYSCDQELPTYATASILFFHILQKNF